MRVSLFALVALGLSSAALAQPPAAPTDDEKKTIDLVVKAGGKATIDARLAPEARVSAKFEAANNATLASLKKAAHLGALDVYDAAACTDVGFLALKQLPHLRKLTLGKSAMSVPAVAAIAQCKELRVLYVPNSGLTDSELAALKKLAFLEALDVSDNPLSDRAATAIKTMDRLQILYLNKTGLTDKGLADLKALDGLRALYVIGTKVTGEAAEKFADEMPNLRAVKR